MAAPYLKELMRKKDEIESNIKSWYDVLKTQGNVGMDEPMVDKNGYPRNDIDIVQVRTARHNIICLQNDHKELMKQIETGLVEYHAQQSEMDTSGNSNKAPASSTQHEIELVPFAAIDLVSRTSPAEAAGLKIGDVILKFGSVTKNNFSSVNTIGQVVKHSIGKPINVVIKRGEQQVVSVLTPQNWGGRGLLGCNIVPL